MDPIAHSFTGAALAAAGLRRTTPLATAALLIGANAPDVDVVTAYAGEYAALALRRGWTHGVLALAVLPVLITGLLLAWHRLRGRPGLPVRAGPLLALAALGTLTHPVLDWLNNYGMRWLMPFDGRWSYGDALFIVDPWVWLVLGGVLFLAGSRRVLALSAWAAFWLLATWLIWTAPMVPMPSRVAWTAGLVVLLVLRFRDASVPDRPARSERRARTALTCVAAYMAAALAASFVARAEVRAEARGRGIGPVTEVMVAPAAANPFAGTVVVVTASEYHVGTWHWLSDARLALDATPIDRRLGDPVVAAASQATDARRYLAWSRFPYFEVEERADGHVVRVRDARYHGTGRLSGPDVLLDLELRPVPTADRRHTAH